MSFSPRTRFRPAATTTLGRATRQLDDLIARTHYGIDPAERKRLYADITARVDAALPVYPIVWRKAIFAVSTRLRNVSPEPVNSDLWDVTRWRVDDAK